MQQFRDIFAAADVAILSRLGEDATLDGQPVRGEMSTPVDRPGFSGAVVGMQQQAFRLPDSQAATAARDSVLICNGETFRVVNIVPEGTGITALILRFEA